eukprot:GHVS01007120.1.p1 GENE.GHVS01007120.1~~GHVS01007120.1.p1  ORF type:complete len:546 (-),score=75.60 GHVS01007120.1:1536-3173(-)
MHSLPTTTTSSLSMFTMLAVPVRLPSKCLPRCLHRSARFQSSSCMAFRSSSSVSSQLQFRLGGHIDGKYVETDKKFPVIDPGTGEVIAQVSCMTAEHTRQAIEAAHRAFIGGWSKTAPMERHIVLMRWFGLMKEKRQDIGQLLSSENGKPINEALNEVDYAASFVEWFAEQARTLKGDVISSPYSTFHHLYTVREPVGVCSLITPWNFPAAMITRKAAAAMAAGCTSVIKPAEDTPLTALALVALAEQAGTPAGVLNVVPCDRDTVAEVGHVLATHPLVRKVSLTGSTAVGTALLKLSADTVKRVSMELGGNAPFIIFDDADIDNAVKGAMVSKFRHSGQTCVCANRMYVHKSVWEEFSSKLVTAVKQLQIGHGRAEGTTIGPLINQKALDRVADLTKDAIRGGAKVLCGGEVWKDKQALGGTFFQPTVLDCRGLDTSPSGPRIVVEEIFGPVAALYDFVDEEDVIERANKSEAGLACYFYSRDVNRVARVSRHLQSGMIGVNTGSFSCAEIPFGGIKQSGLGREGSSYGLDEYTYIKAISMPIE